MSSVWYQAAAIFWAGRFYYKQWNVYLAYSNYSLFSQPGSMGLHSLIAKLKKWIKTLEEKAKLLPK